MTLDSCLQEVFQLLEFQPKLLEFQPKLLEFQPKLLEFQLFNSSKQKKVWFGSPENQMVEVGIPYYENPSGDWNPEPQIS